MRSHSVANWGGLGSMARAGWWVGWASQLAAVLGGGVSVGLDLAKSTRGAPRFKRRAVLELNSKVAKVNPT